MALLLVLAGAVASTEPAQAEATGETRAAFRWDAPSGPVFVTSLRQSVRVDELGRRSYTALTWTFGDDSTGYLGIQRNPTTADGSPAPEVGFSFTMGSASAATGRHCGIVSGGSGRRCTLPVDFVPGARFEFLVEYVGDTVRAGSWRASVSYRDSSDQLRRQTIGTIIGTSTRLDMSSLNGVVKYVGAPPSTCSGVPVSTVRFGRPVARLGAETTRTLFNRTNGITGAPQPCQGSRGANLMTMELENGTLLARLGGRKERSAGVELRSPDGLCLSPWDATEGSPLVALQCVGDRLDRRWYFTQLPTQTVFGYFGPMFGSLSIGGRCLDWSGNQFVRPLTMQPCVVDADGIPTDSQLWDLREDGTIHPQFRGAFVDNCVANIPGQFLGPMPSDVAQCGELFVVTEPEQVWRAVLPSGSSASPVLPDVGTPPGVTADLGISVDSRGAVRHRWRVAAADAATVEAWISDTLQSLGWQTYGMFLRQGDVLIDTDVTAAATAYPGEYRLSLVWVN